MAEESPTGMTKPSPKPRILLPAVGRREFDDIFVQRSFLRKVLLTLAIQLLLPMSFVCLFLYIEKVKVSLQKYEFVFYMSCGIYVLTLISLILLQKRRREFPFDLLALIFQTVFLSFMLGTMAAFYDAVAVLVALVIVSCLFFALALFLTITTSEFTCCRGFLFILFNVVVYFGSAVLIVWLVGGKTYILQGVFGGVAAFIFGMYLSLDLRMLLAGTVIRLTEDEFLSGALQVYIDMLYIFVIILGVIGRIISGV